MCVTLTPAATRFMKRIVRFAGAPAGSGFRLVVRAGGCSGFDSRFTVETAALAGDAVIEEDGLKLFLEAESCALLRGATVDFAESRIDGGLRFSLPGGAAACGCGDGQGTGKRGGQRGMGATVNFMPRPGSCSKPSGPAGGAP